MLFSLLLYFLVTEESSAVEILLGITGLYLLIILFYSYGLASSQNHIFDSLLLIIPELILSLSLLFMINPFVILPFICLQAVELVLERKHLLFIRIYLLASFPAMIGGLILRGEFREIFYSLPSLCTVVILLTIIRLQDRKNRQEYDYMKNLVDNKNKLLSTLTHELRTPLAVIKTSNELVMEERPGPLNETQKSLISSSLENTKRLNALVENILSQVKVEFAWFSMKQKPLDIRKLIRKTALDIKPYLESKNQKLKYNYPSLMSNTIGDKRWLGQVLLNLIHNGIKNSPENSEITIFVQENEQCIVVSVHDSGSGIKSHEISHVFNEFYQSTDPTKDLNEGAGLGLTIVRDIIEKHNGQVYISSLPQSGTTVSFTLPLYKGVFSGTNNTDH
ncbi:MAG: hypothetical protein B6241_11010 [Spirochaetaceae bacterium 4572_59]|nr:MAG: hypothetical protein B6241_11010 [Spirochaetaceae bacterium 4572_59]